MKCLRIIDGLVYGVYNVQIHCNIETSVHQTNILGKKVLTKICSSYDQYFKVKYLFVRLCC